MYANYSEYLKSNFDAFGFMQPQPANIATLSFKQFALSEWKQKICLPNDGNLERELYLSLINGKNEGNMAGQEKKKNAAKRIFAKRRLNQNEWRKRKKKYYEFFKAGD